MKLSGLRLVCIAAAALPAAAQQTDFGAQGLPPQVDVPPRYRVEFIVFAHNRFDPAEEHFDVIPPTSQFAPSDEPIPQRVYDEESAAALRALIDGPIIPPPPEPGLPGAADDEATLEAYLDPRFVAGPATRLLEPEELTLLPTLARLQRLDAYRPLLHAGWEQNGLAEADAVPIDLAEFLADNPRGSIRLHVSRYLHVSLDMAYRDVSLAAPVTGFGGAQTFGDTPAAERAFGSAGDTALRTLRGPEFYLFEQRRILRGELNYFDHPAFGVLLKITLAPEPSAEASRSPGGPSA